MKNFVYGDFYDTDDLEKISKENLINVVEQLQRQLSEAQRIISRIESSVHSYSTCENYSNF